ncbi:hypothetical protein J6590_050635 [Homalodisca vitripennis]|nr:hypothetical protein J6590_050635 [Homalodisca vitripennis]
MAELLCLYSNVLLLPQEYYRTLCTLQCLRQQTAAFYFTSWHSPYCKQYPGLENAPHWLFSISIQRYIWSILKSNFNPKTHSKCIVYTYSHTQRQKYADVINCWESAKRSGN